MPVGLAAEEAAGAAAGADTGMGAEPEAGTAGVPVAGDGDEYAVNVSTPRKCSRVWQLPISGWRVARRRKSSRASCRDTRKDGSTLASGRLGGS